MNEEKSKPSFGGLAVAAFESRHAPEIASLIEHYGGRPRVAASLREVPIEQNGAALDFGEKLLAGEVDAVVFTTGVGARTLLELLETRHSRDSLARALARILVLARGPKPARVLDGYHISAITVPQPFTWPMILQALDGHPRGFSLAGSRIAVQEYGRANEDFLGELAARGAQVLRVPVYRWALPEDTGPLRILLDEIRAGKVRVIIFTSAVQVDHVFQVAREAHGEDSLQRALARAVVTSVGPTCSAAIRRHGVTVDIEPQQNKMGMLIYESARIAPDLLATKDSP